jgi:hypothetical protein
MRFLDSLYNIDSFEAMASKKDFADASGVVLARNLEFVSPKILEQKFPALTFLQSGIMVDNAGGYASKITKRKTTVVGDTSFGGSDFGANKGKISISREEDSINVYDDFKFSEWTQTDLKKAELEGINLVTEYIKGHNKIYNELIDKAGYEGVLGNDGLFNYSGFASSGATGAFSGLTAQEMYEEMTTLILDQWNGVYNTDGYMANVVATSPIIINLLTKTMLNTASGTASVMKALQDNFAGIKFVSTNKAYNGTSSVAVAFNNSEDAMSFRIPLKLEIGEIIKPSSFTYKVESMFRVAGLDVAEDGAGRKLTGL